MTKRILSYLLSFGLWVVCLFLLLCTLKEPVMTWVLGMFPQPEPVTVAEATDADREFLREVETSWRLLLYEEPSIDITALSIHQLKPDLENLVYLLTGRVKKNSRELQAIVNAMQKMTSIPFQSGPAVYDRKNGTLMVRLGNSVILYRDRDDVTDSTMRFYGPPEVEQDSSSSQERVTGNGPEALPCPP